MRYEIKWLILLSLRVQIFFLSSVEFLCFACRNDAVWFLYLVLKSDVRFTSAIVLNCDGGLVENWWLEAVSVEWACITLSAVACFMLITVSSAVLSMCSDGHKMCLLWLSIICLVLFMLLKLILMVLRLKFFLSLWSLGKCLSVSDIGADVFAEWRVVPEYVVPLPVFLFVSCGWFVV